MFAIFTNSPFILNFEVQRYHKPDFRMTTFLLQRLHPGIKAMYFLLVTVFCGSLLVLTSSLAIAVISGSSIEAIEEVLGEPENPSYLSVLRVLTAMNQIGAFIVGSWLFLKLAGPVNRTGLLFRPFRPYLWIIVPLAMLSAGPLIDLLVRVNEWLLPEGGYLESYVGPMEKAAEEMTQSLLAVDGWPPLLFNLIFIGILPAFGEEIAFRGILQPLIGQAGRNIHLGIWLSAFIFSAYHLQFYGFLPRMAMAAFFGYLVVWTGSIWPAILAHTTNNVWAVLVYYIQGENTHYQWGETPPEPWLIVAGSVVFFGILFYLRRDSQWKEFRLEYMTQGLPEERPGSPESDNN